MNILQQISELSNEQAKARVKELQKLDSMLANLESLLIKNELLKRGESWTRS